MTIPSRADFLAEVDKRFRVQFPAAPQHLQPENSEHAGMIQRWRELHNEVLYAWTDEVFFSYFPGAPKRLDPGNSDDSGLIEYWNDIAAQIRDGTPGKYNWSGTPDITTTAAGPVDSVDDEEPEKPAQDGSVGLERAIEYIRTLLTAYVEVIAFTELAQPTIEHVNKQVEVLRGLVKDGTFTTYNHWWRSAEFQQFAYEEGDPSKGEIASIKDLTVEAKIDRKTGELDTHLAGWAHNRDGNYFGRMSRAGE
jgi:hypothetical protein